MLNRFVQRPSYFSSKSGTSYTISYDFETFIINLSVSDINMLISRLRSSITGTNKRVVRDDLCRQALTNDLGDCSAIISETNSKLGDFQNYKTSLLTNTDISEVSQMCDDMASGYKLPLFINRYATYNSIYDSLKIAEIKAMKTGSTSASSLFKKEVSSYITILYQYLNNK